MQIIGTITRAFVGEGQTGTNSRFNGKNVIHVRPTDPAILKELDGDHQTGAGEIRLVAPDGDLPEIGTEVDVEVDETKKTLELKPEASAPSRRSRRGGGEGEST